MSKILSISQFASTSRQQLRVLTAMENLRQQQMDTDVQLQCQRGVVHAHRLILRNSCPYFEAMFSVDSVEKASETKAEIEEPEKENEKKTEIVNLQLYDQDAIEVIVQYLYTGQTPETNNFPLLINLIEACRLMQLADLFNCCWESLLTHLNVNTFSEIWLLGLKFDLVKQDQKIFQFMQDNIADICERGNVESFEEEEFEELIDLVNCTELSGLLVDCILKWKSQGNREDAAIKLLEKIDLHALTSKDLQKLVGVYQNKKKKDIEYMIMEEVVQRLISAHEASAEITNSQHFNSTCRQNGSSCTVYQSMRSLKSLCESLMKSII